MEYQSNHSHTAEFSQKMDKAESLLDAMGVSDENKRYVLDNVDEDVLDAIIENPEWYNDDEINGMRRYVETA